MASRQPIVSGMPSANSLVVEAGDPRGDLHGTGLGREQNATAAAGGLMAQRPRAQRRDPLHPPCTRSHDRLHQRGHGMRARLPASSASGCGYQLCTNQRVGRPPALR